MDDGIDHVDWTLLQAFLAVAELGTLSAAAIRLGTTQPTVGRQIKAIEQQLGAVLFVRKPRGLMLSKTGESLVSHATRMQEAAHQISLIAAGQEQALAGTVRITASDVMSHQFLPPILAAIRIAEPDIELELLPSDATENLLFREADIAIRMYRPSQLDLVATQVGSLELGVFAASEYLDRAGRPQSTEEFVQHQFVGYDRNELIIQGMRAAGLDVDRHHFKTRCDNQLVYWELVRQGCGIGFAPRRIGTNDSLVEELLLDFPIEPLPVWLTAHAVLRSSARINRVWTLLRERLPPQLLGCQL